jgi:hypothetical protein
VRRIVSVLAAASLLAAGCGDDEESTQAATVKTKPGCERIAPAGASKAPAGLHVPDAKVVVGPSKPREGEEQITIVSGYIELDPSKLAAAFRGHEGWKILFDENDGYDAEVMVTDGTTRNFWKLVRRCEGGSSFTATLAPEE